MRIVTPYAKRGGDTIRQRPSHAVRSVKFDLKPAISEPTAGL
jgi:hypothetical protein